MPAVLKIDRKRKIAVSTFYGEVTDGDLLGHRDTIQDNRGFQPEFSEIVDFSGATSLRLSQGTIAAMAQAQSIFHRSALHILVAPADEQYRAAVHFRELARSTRPNLYVVRTLEEAYALLEEKREK